MTLNHRARYEMRGWIDAGEERLEDPMKGQRSRHFEQNVRLTHDLIEEAEAGDVEMEDAFVGQRAFGLRLVQRPAVALLHVLRRGKLRKRRIRSY
ncbi:hypothetical protein [Coraliomargarita akajimensis]|uniref:Uncharacterized protein n=1 Tax=Coraliomargarita akajimensis (strain DSM 45221 / IAM 15411 / JCM 23193 / KCTC 12865 / 04OKA010-24) TaxID=583355 RepID=D5EJI9_CORAD|nr:hypothetical protein [Coraliomargarita akajimensis]ADE54588.1 hypothetical protein Caka_1569 [Coraliomargarita akajimensis DSM 45221]